MRILPIALLTLWGLPITIWSLIGSLCASLLGWLQFHSIHTDKRLPFAWALRFSVKPETRLNRYMQRMLQGVHGGAKGAAHGHVIAFRESTLPPNRKDAIILYELRHTWQFMTYGILQPIIYAGWNITMRPKLGILGAYYTNPFEKDAYIFSGEKELYEKRLQEHVKKQV